MREVATSVDAELDRLLARATGPQARLFEAMRYASLGSGKRFRPCLVVASGRLFDVPAPALVRVAAAIEMIHAYSLIHDDLPAMDDAALRRGRPTVHRAFDDATAILAGDALQALAFETLAEPFADVSAEIRCRLSFALARSAGGLGMCGGQMIDLIGETRSLDAAEIAAMERLKTGALIEFSCLAGPILAAASQPDHESLRQFARAIGLAFQIQDDVLDATASSAVTGKDAQRDGDAGKSTFVTTLGLDGAKARLEELRIEARDSLVGFAERSALLGALGDFVIERQH